MKLPEHMAVARGESGLPKEAKMTKEQPWERYERRQDIPLSAGTVQKGLKKGGGEQAARERLMRCNLWEFVTQYEFRGGQLVHREEPRVLIPKPFLHLDMMRPTAGRTARRSRR